MESHNNCRHLLDSLSEFIDGDLRQDLCAEIELHMEGCERCRIVVDTLKKTVYLYRATESEPCDVPEDVRQRLYQRLELEDLLRKHD